MREKDIIFESAHHTAWVHRDRKRNAYVVFQVNGTHSVSDSAYAMTEDGLSIAKMRAEYLDKRVEQKKQHHSDAEMHTWRMESPDNFEIRICQYLCRYVSNPKAYLDRVRKEAAAQPGGAL